MSPHEQSEFLSRVFSHHPPSSDQQARYHIIRTCGRYMAEEIVKQCPDSEERSTALMKLREVVLWANAAIACNELGQEG